MTARFALDEDKARDWVPKCVALCEEGTRPDPGVTVAETLGENYDPRSYDDHGTTGELLSAAHAAAVVTGPGEILWDFLADDSGDVGYRWMVDVTDPATLRLADLYEDLRHLGDPEAADTTEAALSVLREAVQAGNSLLAKLDAYCAAHAVDRIRNPPARHLCGRSQFPHEPREGCSEFTTPV
jgi:hypothetical protein